jgi:hypothetical protein
MASMLTCCLGVYMHLHGLLVCTWIVVCLYAAFCTHYCIHVSSHVRVCMDIQPQNSMSCVSARMSNIHTCTHAHMQQHTVRYIQHMRTPHHTTPSAGSSIPSPRLRTLLLNTSPIPLTVSKAAHKIRVLSRVLGNVWCVLLWGLSLFLLDCGCLCLKQHRKRLLVHTTVYMAVIDTRIHFTGMCVCTCTDPSLLCFGSMCMICWRVPSYALKCTHCACTHLHDVVLLEWYMHKKYIDACMCMWEHI